MAMAGPSTAQAGMMQPVQPGALRVPGAMTPPQPSMQAPQTGLIGSEQALMGGQQQALGAMGAGNSAAQGYLQNIAGMQIQPSQMLGSQAPTVAGATMAGAQLNAPAELNNPYVQNFNAAGYNAGVGASQFDQGVAGLDPYAQQGQGAAKLQADLTGANGQAAQQAAMRNTKALPQCSTKWIKCQKPPREARQLAEVCWAAMWRLELQKNSAGIASQDYQNQFNNMSQVTNTGLNAATLSGSCAALRDKCLGTLRASKCQPMRSFRPKKWATRRASTANNWRGKPT
jgi:hypothetical protein